MEDPGLATEEEECPLATSPLATSLLGRSNRSSVDSRPTRSGGGGPRCSSVWGRSSARWPQACRVRSVGPALMLDLPGVDEEDLDGPRRGRGVVAAGLEPGGSGRGASSTSVTS